MIKPNHDAVWIVKKLRGAGFAAYLVGGCVRDMLLGKAPKDWDVATDARPDDVMRIFRKTIPVGAQFGVVIVRMRNRNYEVATFRKDCGYTDGRRPDRVVYSSAEEDARRRDFTINGLFYDPLRQRVIDYVGGRKDLDKGIVRAIGDPDERFSEDKLRLLRAVRFAARFEFRLERKTGEAIRKRPRDVLQVSPERIRQELVMVLADERPDIGVRLMDRYGLLEAVLPEVAAMKGVEQPPQFHPEGDVFEHTMIMLGLMKKKYKQRPGFVMGVLLHDVGKPVTFEVRDRIRFDRHSAEGAAMTRRIMSRLRFSDEATRTAVELVKHHLRFIDVQKMRPATLKRFLRMDDFDLHLELHRLDCIASHGDMSSYRFCKRKLDELGGDEESLRPPRLLTGNDLIEMGFEPGPEFKKILTALEDAQLEGAVRTRDEAVEWVRKHWLD